MGLAFVYEFAVLLCLLCSKGCRRASPNLPGIPEVNANIISDYSHGSLGPENVQNRQM